MLGTKKAGQDKATLSQGTFAQSVIGLYSKYPFKDKDKMYNGEEIDKHDGTVLRHYFVYGKEDIILKILLNCFTALSEVFKNEWDNPKENILCKTTGFCSIIKALPKIIEKGYECQNLTKDYFYKYFEKVSGYFKTQRLSFSSEHFGSGEVAQDKLAQEILKPHNTFKYTESDTNK